MDRAAGGEMWAEALERIAGGPTLPSEIRAAVVDRHAVGRLAANVARLYEELTGA